MDKPANPGLIVSRLRIANSDANNITRFPKFSTRVPSHRLEA